MAWTHNLVSTYYVLILLCFVKCEPLQIQLMRHESVTIRSEFHQGIYSNSMARIARTREGDSLNNTPRFRLYDSMILFPSSSVISPGESTGSSGRCILSSGEIGTCKLASLCSTFSKINFQTQHLVQCGRRGELICCPRSGESRPTPSPLAQKPLVNAPLQQVPTVPTTSPPIIRQTPPPASNQRPPLSNVPVQQESPKLTATSTTDSKLQSPFDFQNEDAQEVCGVYKEDANSVWPWIVSVGRRFENGSYEWTCLGSLITKEFILTAAICLGREPNVIAIGKPLLGPMSDSESDAVDIRSISQVLTHEKFRTPYLYKNVGLIQISSPISVTESKVPVCFPFLAGVLDIIQFVGFKGKTVVFNIPVQRDVGVKFKFEEYRVLNNTQCSKVFGPKQPTAKRFPFGIKSDNMCGIQRKPTSLCQAPGAPLVIYDGASSSYVQIGISSGDPTCSELRRQIVTFTRLNSFSNWVRERVGDLPTSPPCYI